MQIEGGVIHKIDIARKSFEPFINQRNQSSDSLQVASALRSFDAS
jgi:hypothetical protein